MKMRAPFNYVTVSLLTTNDVLVTYAFIPPFNAMPAVIMFGSRVFQYRDNKTYTEVFAYTLAQPVCTEVISDAPEETE